MKAYQLIPLLTLVKSCWSNTFKMVKNDTIIIQLQNFTIKTSGIIINLHIYRDSTYILYLARICTCTAEKQSWKSFVLCWFYLEPAVWSLPPASRSNSGIKWIPSNEGARTNRNSEWAMLVGGGGTIFREKQRNKIRLHASSACSVKTLEIAGGRHFRIIWPISLHLSNPPYLPALYRASGTRPLWASAQFVKQLHLKFWF